MTEIGASIHIVKGDCVMNLGGPLHLLHRGFFTPYNTAQRSLGIPFAETLSYGRRGNRRIIANVLQDD